MTDLTGTKVKIPEVKTYEPDMLLLNTWYAITVNGTDRVFNFPMVKTKRLRRSISAYSHMFKDFEKVAEYRMLPEISSPKDHDGQTRIHYHGIFRIKTYEQLSKFYLYGWNSMKEYCSVKIKPIECFQSWKNYTEKNLTVMTLFMLERGLPYQMCDGHRLVKFKGL